MSVPASLSRVDFDLKYYWNGTDWKALSIHIVRIEDIIIAFNLIVKLGKKIL